MLVALVRRAAYASMGAAWLIYKTEGELQRKAVRWLRVTPVFHRAGMAAVSLATPLASPRIFDKWFVLPQMLPFVSPLLPILPSSCSCGCGGRPTACRSEGDRHAIVPFLTLAVIFAFRLRRPGMVLHPFFVVPDRLTISWQAASAPESLAFMLVGTVIVLPIIIFYLSILIASLR